MGWIRRFPLLCGGRPATQNWWFEKPGQRVNGVMFAPPLPPTVEELIAKLAFYGMAKIPADLLDCLDEITADLAADAGTGRRVRSAFPDRLAS
jgi:hypothetical protein